MKTTTKESNEADYDEEGDQLDEIQEEETGKNNLSSNNYKSSFLMD